MSVGTCDFLCPSQARSSSSSLLRAQLHPEPEERGTEHPQGCLRAAMVTLLFLQSYCTEPLSLGLSSALPVPGALGAQSPRGLCCQPRADAQMLHIPSCFGARQNVSWKTHLQKPIWLQDFPSFAEFLV